jgi:hypothetical protein
MLLNQMKTNAVFSLLSVMAVVAGFMLSSCDKEEPTKTRVFGTITIVNEGVFSTWKDSGELQVTIFPKFSLDPLAGWGAIPDNTLGPNVPGGTFAIGAPYNAQNPVILTYVPGKTTYDYEIELEPGTYSALALGFRHNRVTDPSRKTATLGVHWGNPDQTSHGVVIKVAIPGGGVVPVFNFPAPLSFDIAEGEEKEINFKADFNFVNSWYR